MAKWASGKQIFHSLIHNLILEKDEKDKFLLSSINRCLHTNAVHFKINKSAPDDSRWVPRLHLGQYVPLLLLSAQTVATKIHSNVIGQYYSDYIQTQCFWCQFVVPYLYRDEI